MGGFDIIKAGAEAITSGTETINAIVTNSDSFSNRRAKREFEHQLDAKKQEITIDRIDSVISAARMRNLSELQSLAIDELERNRKQIDSLPDSDLKRMLLTDYMNKFTKQIFEIIQAYDDNIKQR